jgi:5-methylcytosine-specific restriction endonuclease McrA
MSFDYTESSGLLYPKARARVLDRIDQKKLLAKQERECRRAVKARDKGLCRACKKHGAIHMHHIQFRSQGGKYQTCNIVSLCTDCHKLVHGGVLRIAGDADKPLTFARSKS